MEETSLQLKVSHGNSGNDDSGITKKPHLQAVSPAHYATDSHVHNTAVLQSAVEGNHVYILVNIFSLHFFIKVEEVIVVTSPDSRKMM